MATNGLKLALAQVNPTVGAVAENATLISAGIARARDEGADLVVFGELCLSGYPAEDLYLKRHFLARCADELAGLAEGVEGIAALVGFPEVRAASADPHAGDAPRPRHAHNSLALLRDGKIEAVYRKQRLPNYAVFDERRYFERGTEPMVIEVAGTRVLIDPGGFSPDAVFELEGLDAILVTHQHPDHVDQRRGPHLVARNPGAVLLTDPQTARTLDFGSWSYNSHGLETVVSGVTLRGVGSEHAVIFAEIPRVANVGVMITADGEPTLLHPGDSYEHAPDGVDVLALPLSAPWAKVSETIDFVRRVSPGTLFPVHDRTISDLAYDIYWNQVANFGSVADSRRLGQDDSTRV